MWFLLAAFVWFLLPPGVWSPGSDITRAGPGDRVFDVGFWTSRFLGMGDVGRVNITGPGDGVMSFGWASPGPRLSLGARDVLRGYI